MNDNSWFKKEKPMLSMMGFGGGSNSNFMRVASGGGGDGTAQGDGNTGYSTTDLILNLDPTDSGSYGGSGTTWYNIASGSSVADFTLSGPTFDSGTNGGLFDFDGSNDHAYSSSSIDFSSYNYLTVDVMLRHDATNAAMIYVEHSADWNGGAYRWGLSSHNNGNEVLANRFHTNHNSVIWWDYDHTASGSGTGWANHVNQFSKVQGNTRKTYVNGTQMTSADSGNSQGQTAGSVSSGANFGDHVLYIGGRGGTSVMFNGKIGFIRIYGSSSEISASTITGNYNAVKSNYGLS